MKSIRRSYILGLLLAVTLGAFAAVTSPHLLLAQEGATATPNINWVNQSVGINVRAGPGLSYDIIGRLIVDSWVQPLARTLDGEWILIMYRSSQGWVQRDGVSWRLDTAMLPVIRDPNVTPLPNNVPPPSDRTNTPNANWVSVGVDGGFVRAGPGQGYLPIGELFTGDVVDAVAQDAGGNWVLIRYNTGYGWIHRELVIWIQNIDMLPVLDLPDLTPHFTPVPVNPTKTATPSPTVTASPTATLPPTATSTPTFTPTSTPTNTSTNTASPTFTATATFTQTPTITPSPTSTYTATATATQTASYTATTLPSDTPAPTATVTPSATASDMPTIPTETPSPLPTETASPAPSATLTSAPTATATHTSTATMAAVLVVTASFTPGQSPSATLTPTVPASATPTAAAVAQAAESEQNPNTGDSSGAGPVEEPSSSQGIPTLYLLAGGLALMVVLYAGVYMNQLGSLSRYREGFFLTRCPVCQQGGLYVDERRYRMLGIPRARRTVRCDNCRSVLREVGRRRWRYAVDGAADPELYDKLNGQTISEARLREISPEFGPSRPEFIDDDDIG